MKSYHMLSLRYLTSQPRRSALTAIGILLVVMLISAVSILTASIRQTQINQAIGLFGDYHGIFSGLTRETVEGVSRYENVEAVGLANDLGSFDLSHFFISIEGMDAIAREMLNMKLLEGRYPDDIREIALEEWVFEQLGLKPEIGQEVTLPYQKTIQNEQGQPQILQGEAAFHVVGILENITGAKASGVSLGLVSLGTAESMLPAEAIEYRAFVRMEAGLSPSTGLSHIRWELGLPDDQLSLNKNLLRALGDGASAVWPIIFLGVLVAVATVATIYNAFHISVLERKRQFGMLRAVGATPAQVLRLVLAEAILLSLAAILPGLALGLGFAWGLSQAMAILDNLVTVLVVPVWTLLGAGASGLAASLISAIYPGLMAGRVSPLDAMFNRSAGGGRTKKKNMLRNRIPIPRLGLPFNMACQNLGRDRKRSLVTFFSLGLGVVIFIVFSAFASSANAENVITDLLRGDYALSAFNIIDKQTGFSPQVYDALQHMDGVDEVFTSRYCVGGILPEDQPSAAGDLPAVIFGHGEAELSEAEAFLIAGKANAAEMGQQPQALVVDREGRSGLQPGDKMTIQTSSWENGQRQDRTQTVIVAGILSKAPTFMGFTVDGVEVLLHENFYRDLAGADVYNRFDITLSPNAKHDWIESWLDSIAGSQPQGGLISYQEEIAKLEKEKQEMMILCYGLVVIVSLIGLTNIVNTLATNLILRTREFGMLRAVGMTTEQLRATTRIEGLLYGLISGGWGAVAGSGFAFILFLVMKQDAGYLEWQLPWLTVVASLLGCMLIGVVATFSPVRRVTSLTIIDAIRILD